jgi:hypothetical protein
VTTVVSDTSEPAAINPDNPGDNPSHNVGRRNPWRPAIYQVPRHPTDVFYDASTVAEEVDEYNTKYRAFYGRDLSYAELLAVESTVQLRHMLQYDADPLMFHQANLRAYTGADQAEHSLYSDWVDAAIDAYLANVRLPVLTVDQLDLGRLMQARGAYDACGVRAVLRDDERGRRLELTGRASCEVPITGLVDPAAGRVETYAGVPTTFVAIDPCDTVTVTLTAPLGP